MKAAKITVAGTTYFLVMDGEAMFTIRDIYGGTRLMLEKMEQDTREGFLETCNAAAILAERGELAAAGWDMSRGASRNATISRF